MFADSDRHTKAYFNNSGWLFGQLLGASLGEVNGPRRAALLAHLTPAFTFRKCRDYIGPVTRDVSAVLEATAAVTSPQLGAKSLVPPRDLKMVALAAIAGVLFGQELGEQKRQCLAALIPVRERLLMKAFTGAGLTRYAWSATLPTQTNRELAWFHREWEAYVYALTELEIGDSGSGSTRGSQPSPARALIEAVGRGEVDKTSALQTLDEMLFANLDVTLGAISWVLVLLASHITVQDTLRAEIKAARDGGSWENYLSDGSTLLAAVILESARVRPLAGFSVPQAAPSDRVVSGYVVPKGTNFIIDAQALNVTHPVWGGDGEVFKPERWLEENNSNGNGKPTTNKGARDLRYQFWRFGFGPRQCLGKYLADLIMRIVVVEVLCRCEMRLHPDASDVKARDPNCWIAMPIAKIQCSRI